MDLDNQNKNRSKRGNKKQKQLIKRVDRISKLPDPVLHHILSFLPAKLAASTSILSKRWRNVWIFTPVLDFRNWWPRNFYIEDYNLPTEIFMNCIDKVLSFNDDMPNLKKLYLQLHYNFDEARVNEWISIAVRRNIEELVIGSASMHYDFTITPCLFTCESLIMLKLDMSSDLELPGRIYFPRLRILEFSGMVFVNEASTPFLFSQCPVLEKLILKDCQLGCLLDLSISTPVLKYLAIDGHDLDDTSVNIYAPSLLSLNYAEHVPMDFDLHGFPLLIDADIDFHFMKSSSETAYAASKLIKELFNVKCLKMSGNTLEALSFADDVVANLPMFRNLIHLEVGSQFPCSAKRTLLDFLQISPNLETLVFAKGFERGRFDGDDCWTLNLVPHCLLLHLKSIELRQFRGHPGELNVVKLFLKNAGILQRVTVISHPNVSTDMTNIVMELLPMLPRSSKNCVIKVL